MGAALDDLPVLDHEDLVGLDDRRQAVGDHDGGAALERCRQRGLHVGLRRRVEVRRRLVEDHDPRLGEQQPGDREALPLAAREPVAALADHRVEPVGQRRRPDRPAGPCRARPTGRRRWPRGGRSAGSRAPCRGTGGRPGSPCRPSSRIDSNVSVAHVDAAEPHRSRSRRRRAAGSATRSSTCRCPTIPTSATSWPGSTRNDTPWSTSAPPRCRAWRPPRATPATPCRPTDRRTGRRRTRPTPARSAARRRPACSVISGSRSSTSKTRSKLTSAVIASTRALAERGERRVELRRAAAPASRPCPARADRAPRASRRVRRPAPAPAPTPAPARS